MAERFSIFWLRKESAGERWSVKMQALNKLNVMRAVYELVSGRVC